MGSKYILEKWKEPFQVSKKPELETSNDGFKSDKPDCKKFTFSFSFEALIEDKCSPKLQKLESLQCETSLELKHKMWFI